MKLQVIHEARYSGEHPIVTKINNAIENDLAFDFDMHDEGKVNDAINGLRAAFGRPTEDIPASDEDFASMMWDLPNDVSLVVIFGIAGRKANFELIY